MRRALLILVTAAMMMTAFVAGSLTAAPGDLDEYNGTNKVRDWNVIAGTACFNGGAQRRLVPNGQTPTVCTATTTVAPTTTRPPTTTTGVPSTTTLAPTTTSTTTPTTSSSSTSSTTLSPAPTTSTTIPPTTTVPSGVQFVETFDGNTGLNRFNRGVWHRDPNAGVSQWQGDHDLNCGTPATSRTIHRNAPAESFYTCADHMMTAIGDTSGFSEAWFSPNMSFPSVREISFDVNMTDLGYRKWWKVGVVTEALYNSTNCNVPYAASPPPEGCAPGFLVGPGASDLPQNMQGPNLLYATRGSDLPPTISIGDADAPTSGPWWPSFFERLTDKMTRFPVSLKDNGNNSVTVTVSPPAGGYPGFSGVTATLSGVHFPPCPCRVVFLDVNYTPDKAGVTWISNPYTWHWDNIVVR